MNTPSPDIRRVALYARVSTRDKGQDPENQLEILREYAKQSQFDITAEYVDKASGAKSDRAQFQKMMTAARGREFDLLLFWSLDRFTREGVLPTLQYLEQLTSYGVAYRSHTEEWIDSAGMFRDAIIGIMATLAKQERVRLSERVKAGLTRARSKGKQLGKTPLPASQIAEIKKLRKTMSVRKTAAKLGLSVGVVQKYSSL